MLRAEQGNATHPHQGVSYSSVRYSVIMKETVEAIKYFFTFLSTKLTKVLRLSGLRLCKIANINYY